MRQKVVAGLIICLQCLSFYALSNSKDAASISSKDSLKTQKHLVRLHVPSLFLDQLFMSYEYKLFPKVTINISSALINNTMFPISLVGFDKDYYDNGYGSNHIVAGGFVKLGVNYYFEKNRDLYSFQGRFLRPEFSYTNFNKTNYIRYEWVMINNEEVSVPITSDIRYKIIGFSLNYGRQFLFCENWSFAYVIGLGIGFDNKTYTNPNFITQNSGFFDGFPEYYYSHLGSRSPQLMSNVNFSIGYAF
jgi:hypothetical protein